MSAIRLACLIVADSPLVRRQRPALLLHFNRSNVQPLLPHFAQRNRFSRSANFESRPGIADQQECLMRGVDPGSPQLFLAHSRVYEILKRFHVQGALRSVPEIVHDIEQFIPGNTCFRKSPQCPRRFLFVRFEHR
jgi:hypothetical protein